VEAQHLRWKSHLLKAGVINEKGAARIQLTASARACTCGRGEADRGVRHGRHARRNFQVGLMQRRKYWII
jgi:hypothetical protein